MCVVKDPIHIICPLLVRVGSNAGDILVEEAGVAVLGHFELGLIHRANLGEEESSEDHARNMTMWYARAHIGRWPTCQVPGL